MGGPTLACFLCFVLAQILIAEASGPYFFVVAPNVFRFGYEEEVVISVLGTHGVQTVSLHLEINNGQDVIRTPQTSVNVQSDTPNTTTVEVQPEHISYENRDDKPRTVTLVANSSFAGEQRVDILLSYDSGYIFIETDKPIYYPRDTVKFRTLCLTEGLEELNKNVAVMVEMIDPKGLVMMREKQNEEKQRSAFYQSDFRMTNHPTTGTWTISVRFAGEYETQVNSTFQVEEYKLPTFGVAISVNESIIHGEQEDGIRIDVKAEYVYKKPVNGGVVLDLFIYNETADGKEGRLILRMRGKLSGGLKEFRISMEDMRLLIEDVWFPEEEKLLVRATVTEDATGAKEVGEHSSTVFSHYLYNVYLTKSRRYYHVGQPYYIQVQVRFINGSIAPFTILEAICDKCATKENDGRSLADGDNAIVFETDQAFKGDLLFEVGVHGQNSPKVALTVQPYGSPNIVSMDKDTDHGTHKINVQRGNRDAELYTSLVTLFSSRGAPYQAANGRSVIEINYNEMTKANPSARAIAFYVVKQTNEVVADSMRLALENKCQKELTLDLKDKGSMIKPGDDTGLLTINGVGEMYVGMKFMDKALLYRNNKNILQPLSLFRKLDQHDLGCGQGGGTDSVSVFQNAGLTVVTNANLSIPRRENVGCQKSNRRKRRSAGKYQDCGEGDECCKYGQTLADGFRRNYEDNKEKHVGADALRTDLKRLKVECFQKAYNISATNTKNCISSVYRRCMDIITFHFEDNYSMSRFLGDDNMEYITDLKEADITFRNPRSNFDESFLFQLKAVTDTDEVRFTYPDSITEWMVSAIGFSKQYGVCITDSVNITTFKEFFVHLDLPYSAVRLEHVDVKATVFNYDTKIKNVSLYMEGVSDVCSNAEPGQHTQRKLLTLQANSAQTVRFPIIPLKAGSSGTENKFDIIVKAIDVSSGTGAYDYIKKSLYVKNEGVLVTKKIQVCLDPQAISEDCINTADIIQVSRHLEPTNGTRTQIITITLKPPPNIIEGSVYVLARITGNDVMVEAVDTILNGVGGLIRKAVGCGEQTMIYLAPGVYAMNYLKKTGTLTSEYETIGNQLIPDGIRRMLMFRKDDGSYAVWYEKYPSSTWLTAFVLKVFCQADEVVSDPLVKDEHVTPGIQWLAGKQNEGGEFREDYKVHHGEMIGQLKMTDPSLTAFVLIAMSECTSRGDEISQSGVKAKTLLENEDPNSLTAYQVSIITYALALTKSNERYTFKARLLEIITHVQGKDMSYIGNSGDANSASAGSIETTSYALLALLKFDELQVCNKLVNWLMLHRKSGGSFQTTQTTVVGLQALSEYNIKTFHSEVNLKIRIAGNTGPVTKLTPQNSMVPKLNVNIMNYLNKKDELVVTVEGTGKGRFLIDYRYNRKPNEDEVCDFEVTSIDPKKSTDKDIIFWKCSNEDDLIQEQAINLGQGALEPVLQRTGRKRRQAQNVDMHYCVSFNVSTKASGESAPTGMSVVDFEIQTGLTVHEPDFEKLVRDGVIQSYDTPSSGDGFIIIYLEDISAEPREITFRLIDEGTTTMRQSAMVNVYNYYSPDKKCSSFYNVGFKKGKAVDYFCPKDQPECRCLLSECSSDYLSQTFRPYRLNLITCTKADYGVIVKILAVRNREQPGYIEAEAEVNRVLKTGSEVDLDKGDTMVFYWRELCSWPAFQIGKNYVIVANEGKHRTVNGETTYDYPLMHGAIVFERRKATTKVGKLISRYVKMMERGCKQ